MGATQSTSILVHGLQIRVQTKGRGEPLLVLHGERGAEWSQALDALSEHFEVILPTHPGFGGSDVPNWLGSIHDLAYFYLDLIDALQRDSLHVMGLRLGGWLAAEAAIRCGSRMRSLTLVTALGLLVREAPQMDMFLLGDEERLHASLKDPDLATRLAATESTDEIADQRLLDNLAVARLCWQPRNHDPHLHHWLHRIRMPTLVVWGEQDKVLPLAYGEAYAGLLPQSRLITLPDCGHLVDIEQPQALARAVSRFVRQAETVL